MQVQQTLITIASLELERLVQFYQALLGQAPAVYQAQTYAEFRLPGSRLGIFCPRADQRALFPPGAGAISLCLEVDSLEAAIACLETLNCAPRDPIITASHGREVYAYDPDGNRLIVHQSWPQSA